LRKGPARLEQGGESLVEREAKSEPRGRVSSNAKGATSRTWPRRGAHHHLGAQNQAGRRGGDGARGPRLEELGRRRERLETPRQGVENLVDSYSEMIPEGLEALPSETRHRVYRMLELMVTARIDGTLLANMIIGETPEKCALEFASSSPRTPSLL
jgi:hypothetical protein